MRALLPLNDFVSNHHPKGTMPLGYSNKSEERYKHKKKAKAHQGCTIYHTFITTMLKPTTSIGQ